LYPRSAQREDADFQTTAIHLCDASAADVEDRLPKFGRWKVLFGVAGVDCFGGREGLFQSDLARRLRRLRLRRIHRMLAHRRGVQGPWHLRESPRLRALPNRVRGTRAPGDSIFLVCWLQASFRTDRATCVASGRSITSTGNRTPPAAQASFPGWEGTGKHRPTTDPSESYDLSLAGPVLALP
jgi:hypothetical protein